MTRFSKAFAGLAGGAAIAALAAAPALAFTTPSVTNLGSPSDNAATTQTVEVVRGVGLIDGVGNATPNPNSGDTLTINFSGFAATQATYKAFLCNPKAANPVYDGILDCAELSGATVATATGSGTMSNIRVGDGGFFVRHDGQRDWECAESTPAPAPGDSFPKAGVVDPTDFGVGPTTLYRDCYVVVRNVSTSQSDTTPSSNELFPVSFVAANPGTQVPEAPYAALMPLAALAVGGGAFLIVRRRSAAV
jgi:hypothetical protein